MQHPLGKLIAIGGAEDKGVDPEKGESVRTNLNFFELGILRRIVEEAGGPDKRMEVITTASMIPYEVGENYVIIDSHFEKRGRFGRLAQAIATNPQCLGIGLGEDTGMLITEGNKMEAIGSGLVIIIDGHDIRHNNIADIPEGNPISIENLKVHFCEKGNGYYLHERKFIPHAYMSEMNKAV